MESDKDVGFCDRVGVYKSSYTTWYVGACICFSFVRPELIEKTQKETKNKLPSEFSIVSPSTTKCNLQVYVKCTTQKARFTHQHKVDVAKSNIAIIWTPIIDRYVYKCGPKKGHQEDMCLKDIGLRVQHMLIILGSIIIIIWRTYMTI